MDFRSAVHRIRRRSRRARIGIVRERPGRRRCARVQLARHAGNAGAFRATAWDFFLTAGRATKRQVLRRRRKVSSPITQLEHARSGSHHAGDAPRRRARAASRARAGARRGRRRADDHPGQQGAPRHELDPMAIGRASRARRSTRTSAPRRSRRAPTKRSRSCAGPSAGAPTP